MRGLGRFPLLKISGGPHTSDIVAELDGRPMERVHRTEIVIDVNDVVRVKTYQMVRADLELGVEGVVDSGWVANVAGVVIETVTGGTISSWVPLARGVGATQAAALRDAADELEKAVPDVPVQ